MADAPPAKTLRFGDLLREHRLAAGFSQEHLADIARMSVTAVGALERGIRLAPYRATVNLLAEALGLDEADRAELESAASRARARGRPDSKKSGSAHNLPPPQTSFLGRKTDLRRLRDLIVIQKSRMVTITGSGGVGKSRLAIEMARDMLDNFAEGTWLVQLSRVTDPDLLPNAIASVVGVQVRDDRDAIEALGQALRRRKLLLILDNCEHVLASAGHAISVLESACPGLVILATSREPLSLSSEVPYALAPFEVPPQPVHSVEEALGFSAVELFARRAASLGAGVFDLTVEAIPAVVAIVRRLDGLPLAIELAVPKLRVLSVVDLAKRLHDRFELLVDENHTELPRHRALWALIDWSYEKLSDQERFVFESCSVFVGSFTIDAVVAVASRDPLRDTEIYQAFTSIVAKSLVAGVGKDRQRYEMLESIRDYAMRMARKAGRVDTLRRKHAEHYLNVARRVFEFQETVSPTTSLRRFQAEGTHFDAALTWSLGEGYDRALGARLCAALILFFNDEPMRLRKWVLVALEHIDRDELPLTFAALTIGVELLFFYSCDHQQRLPDMERAVEIFRGAGDARDLVNALAWLAWAHYRLGNVPAASELADEAVNLAQMTSTPRRLAWTLHIRAKICLRTDPNRSADMLREALDRYNPVEADALVAHTLSQLAELEYRAGRVPIARDLLYRAVTLLGLEPDVNRRDRAVFLGEYAAYALALDEITPAREAAREALRLELDIGESVLTSFVIQHLALASALLGNIRRAVLLLGYCMAVTASLSDSELGIDKDFRDRISAIAASQLSPADIDSLLETGARWDEDRAAEEAFRI